MWRALIWWLGGSGARYVLGHFLSQQTWENIKEKGSRLEKLVCAPYLIVLQFLFQLVYDSI